MVTSTAFGDVSVSQTSDASAASIDGYFNMICCVAAR